MCASDIIDNYQVTKSAIVTTTIVSNGISMIDSSFSQQPGTTLVDDEADNTQ